MNKTVKLIIQYGLSLLAGLAILYFVFRNEDLSQIWLDIKHANYWWILLTYAITLLAHYARAYRWSLLLKQTGYAVATKESFLALLAGYGANLLLPRMGEITRCAVLKKRQHVSFDTSLGTVVAERLFDLLSLLFLFGVTLVWQYDLLFDFAEELLNGLLAGKKGEGLFPLVLIFGGLLASLFIVFLVLRKKLQRLYQQSENGLVLKIRSFLRGLIQGVASIWQIPEKGAFLWSSLLIWVSYYFMAYLIFFALPATSSLSMGAGMAVLAMGAFGIAAPVQGGIGAYHWIVSQTLLLYGISQTDGKTYATLAHASQLIFTIVFSLSAFALILLTKPQPGHENRG